MFSLFFLCYRRSWKTSKNRCIHLIVMEKLKLLHIHEMICCNGTCQWVGVYEGATEHFGLKVVVLNAGKMAECDDLRHASISTTAGLGGCSRPAAVPQRRSKEEGPQFASLIDASGHRRDAVAQIPGEKNGSGRKPSENASQRAA